MIQPLRIGFLTPYSSFYPNYLPQVTTGFFFGLGEMRPNWLTFVPAYTHTGGQQAVEEAVHRLLFFEQCQMVSGLISYLSLPDLIPVLERMQRIGVFLDLGEYLPRPENLSPYAYHNSHQLWQGEYALGAFAQQEFGDEGYTVATLYDEGYHLTTAFRHGLGAAGGQTARMNTLPYNDPMPQNLRFEAVLEEVKREKPPYVHALFSGEAGQQFVAQWAAAGLDGEVPLLLSDPMTQEDVLEDIRHLSISFFAPSLWMRQAETTANRHFVEQFEPQTQHPANIFALLGYEMGLLFRELKPDLLCGDWDKVKTLLQTETIEGPRGARNFYPKSGFALPRVDLLKVTLGNGYRRTVVRQEAGMPYDASTFHQLQTDTPSGWRNPYLCY